MARANPILRSLAVLVILLAALCAGVAIMRANLSRPVITGGRTPTASIQWCIPSAGIRHVSFCPSGRFLCTVSKDNEVTCYSSAGAKCFSTVVPGADRAVVSPEGDCTLVYSHLNRSNTHLTFLDAVGRTHWQMDVPGAVWSADSCTSGDQACFVVGTGARYVYAISIHGSSKRYRRWRTPGVVSSVALDSSGNLSFGTWQSASIARSDLTGHKDWTAAADSDCLQYVQSLGDSARLFVRSSPNRWGVDGEASLVEPDGDCVSKFPLSASEQTRALPSPDGCYVCTGYTRSIRHSAKSRPEKHVALFDYAGGKLWDKGSLLFPTTPVVVTKGGFVLVAGSKNALLAVNPAGEVKQACKLPAAVLSSIPSRDGSSALLSCADGKIHFLRVCR